MSVDNRSVILGPKVLGPEAFKAQQAALAKIAGPVGLGKTHDLPFVPRPPKPAAPEEKPVVQQQRAAAPPIVPPPAPPLVPVAPKTAAPGKPSVPSGTGKAKPSTSKGRVKKPAAAPPIVPPPAPPLVPVAPKTAAPGKPSVPSGTGKAKPSTSKGRVKKPVAAPPSLAPDEVVDTLPSFSEEEVGTMLVADPNTWRRVLESEAERPDGPRPTVIALVLDHSVKATDPVMPEELRAALVGGPQLTDGTKEPEAPPAE